MDVKGSCGERIKIVRFVCYANIFSYSFTRSRSHVRRGSGYRRHVYTLFLVLYGVSLSAAIRYNINRVSKQRNHFRSDFDVIVTFRGLHVDVRVVLEHLDVASERADDLATAGGGRR